MSRRAILPHSVYKREQAAISRRTLVPVTIFYTTAAMVLLILGLRSAHPYWALVFFALGLPVWTMVEYSSHRYVFHRHWKMSKRKYKKYFTYLSNKYLDPTHFGHHEKPFDGMMINGKLKDLMPVFLVSLAVSLLFFPFYSAPLLLGGVVHCYVLEEWAHHCMHYYHFNNRYFRHIKKYHLYHHTNKGMHHGYGITSAFWDVVLSSRFPPEVRQHLFGPKDVTVRTNPAPSEQRAT